MKLEDTVTLNNCIFVHDQTKKNLAYALENYFCKKKDQHNHKTRATQCLSKTHQDMDQILLHHVPFLTGTT